MHKSYKCLQCKNEFQIDEEKKKSKVKFIEGVLVDYDTGEPIDNSISCSICKSKDIVQLIEGVPSANFPVGDLDFYISKKRMQDGLYNDMSSRSKKISKELKEEMSYNNTDKVKNG